jgi:predicted 3-demethylubiquinone-9 3-methyltransferase (glyoxalase superfamily)
MTHRLRTFLTFQDGAAGPALELYRMVFDDFELVDIDRYGAGDGGPEGTVKVATFRVAGTELRCSDSPVRHEWGFTPAVSLWVDCDDDDELHGCSICSGTEARSSCRSTTTGSARASAGSAIATA